MKSKLRRVYLASFYADQQRMREYRDILQAYNITVTSTWIDQAETETLPNLSKKKMIEFADRDFREIRNAHWLVLFDDSDNPSRGKYIEVGYAFALGIPIIVVGEMRSLFYYRVAARRIDSFEHLLKRLPEWRSKL